MKKQTLGSWIIFILLSLIWGSSFILMKESSEDLNGWQIGGLRIFSAGLVFLPFAVFHLKEIPLKKLPLVILSGFLGNLFPAFLFAIAIEKKVNSSMAAILNSLTPLFVLVIALTFFRAKFGWHKIAGVIIGLAGLVLLSLSKGGVTLDNYGFILLILLATVFYGINVNIVSYYLKEVPPLKMATVSLAAMGIIALFVLWQQHMPDIARYDEGARVAIVYSIILGIVGSALATALFYLLIKNAGGLFASLVTYGIPVVGIYWGIVAGETVTLLQIGCLVLILSGVYLVNKQKPN